VIYTIKAAHLSNVLIIDEIGYLPPRKPGTF